MQISECINLAKASRLKNSVCLIKIQNSSKFNQIQCWKFANLCCVAAHGFHVTFVKERFVNAPSKTTCNEPAQTVLVEQLALRSVVFVFSSELVHPVLNLVVFFVRR